MSIFPTYGPLESAAKARGARLRLRALWREDRGAAAVLTGIGLTMLMGCVGLGVDVGFWYKTKRNQQNAADAAAIAAAINGSSNYQYEAKAVAAQYGFNDGVNSTVTVLSDQTCPDGSTVCYRVTISSSGKIFFAAVLGVSRPAISAGALAEQSGPTCILALNATDSGSIDMNGNAQINSPACNMQGNSTSTSGMTQEGQPQANVKKILVSGGYTGSHYSVTPLTDQPPLPDPYASSLGANFPPYTSCPGNPNGLTVKTDTTLSPGTYCGGIHVQSSANLTLLPGVYVMNGGPLWVDGNSSVTGTGVAVAFTGDGATLQLWGNSTLNTTSPTSGPYQNVSFLEDPNQPITGHNGLYFSVGGGSSNDVSKLTTDGLIYVPKQNVWDYGGASMALNSPTMSLICEKLWVQGNASLSVTHNNDQNLTLNPGPTAGLSVVGLVQ